MSNKAFIRRSTVETKDLEIESDNGNSVDFKVEKGNHNERTLRYDIIFPKLKGIKGQYLKLKDNNGTFQWTSGTTGQKGERGNDGNFGGVTFDYTFSILTNSIGMNSSNGILRFNNSDLTSATKMYIDDQDDSTDIQSFLRIESPD